MKLFSKLTIVLAVTALSGCFASTTPVGDKRAAVSPSAFVSAIEDRLPVRVHDEGEKLLELAQDDRPFRLYPSETGFVVEALADAGGPWFIYGYAEIRPDGFAVYFDEFSSVAALAGQKHDYREVGEAVVKDVRSGRAKPFQIPARVTGGMQAFALQPRSIEDVGVLYRELIAAGLEPKAVLKLKEIRA